MVSPIVYRNKINGMEAHVLLLVAIVIQLHTVHAIGARLAEVADDRGRRLVAGQVLLSRNHHLLDKPHEQALAGGAMLRRQQGATEQDRGSDEWSAPDQWVLWRLMRSQSLQLQGVHRSQTAKMPETTTDPRVI